MSVVRGTKRTGAVVVGAGLLLAGLSSHWAAAEELGLGTPIPDDGLAAQSGREGLILSEDSVIGIAKSKADIKDNTLGDVKRFGDVGDITMERNSGITTNMVNTGPYSNMLNTNSVTVNFINVEPNGR